MGVFMNKRDEEKSNLKKGVVETVKDIIQNRKVEVTIQDGLIALVAIIIGFDYAIRGTINHYLGIAFLAMIVIDFLRFKIKSEIQTKQDLFLKADGTQRPK